MKELFFLGAVLTVVCTIWILFRSKYGGRGFVDASSLWDPPVIVNNILTPDECQYIINKAEPLFTRSNVVGTTVDASRTSKTAWISKDDSVVQKVIDKVMELTGKPIENCEDLQVVKYEPGTFYRAHHDSCCDDSAACAAFENDGGQRVGTLLIYLNSEFTDGETHFPDHDDLKIKADTGSAIFFRPLGSDAPRCHPKALHAGLPISTGIKYVCNVWVRENKFR